MEGKQRYRIFRRRWWRDRKCTVPGPGRKTPVAYVYGYEAAQQACARLNVEAYGSPTGRGPYGAAHEFEAA